MKVAAMLVALCLALSGLAGCGGGDAHKDHDHKDHDHKDHDHKDHDHKDESAKKDHVHGENEGKAHPLGKADLAGYSLDVTLFGEVKAGGEVALDVVLSGGTGDPAAVRAWVGVESAEGSRKAKLEKAKTAWHNHLDAPAKLPEGAAIWVEIEDAQGEKKATKFAW